MKKKEIYVEFYTKLRIALKIKAAKVISAAAKIP